MQRRTTDKNGKTTKMEICRQGDCNGGQEAEEKPGPGREAPSCTHALDGNRESDRSPAQDPAWDFDTKEGQCASPILKIG